MMSIPERHPAYGCYRGAALYETMRVLAMRVGEDAVTRDLLVPVAVERVMKLAGYDGAHAEEGVLASLLVLARKGHAEVDWVKSTGRWEKGWVLTASGHQLWQCVMEPGDGKLTEGEDGCE